MPDCFDKFFVLVEQLKDVKDLLADDHHADGKHDQIHSKTVVHLYRQASVPKIHSRDKVSLDEYVSCNDLLSVKSLHNTE